MLRHYDSFGTNMFAAVYGGVDKNSWHPLYPSAATYLPAEISFARDEREIFSEASQSRGKSAIPAMYIPQPRCISFVFSRSFPPSEFLKIEQTNNGGLFPRKFSIDYHRFHYARIVFLSVENISGKKISHREQ